LCINRGPGGIVGAACQLWLKKNWGQIPSLLPVKSSSLETLMQ
jgi:hypothetical protein